MRNAVIVAAGDCVVFAIALISANTYLAIAVVGLSVAGLLLVARDWRAQRDCDEEEHQTKEMHVTPRALSPNEFTPDIGESVDPESTAETTDVTTRPAWSDEQGGPQPIW